MALIAVSITTASASVLDMPSNTSATPNTWATTKNSSPFLRTSPTEASAIAPSMPPAECIPFITPRPAAPTFSTSRARLGSTVIWENPSISTAPVKRTS